MTTKLLIAAVALMVTRDPMTILPATVAAHELEIQKAVFGEDNIEVLDAKPEPIALELEIEAERLEAKYGTGALEKAYGVNFKGAISRAMREAAVGPAPSDEPDLAAMTKDQLLALAKEQGANVTPAMNKAALIEAIQTATV